MALVPGGPDTELIDGVLLNDTIGINFGIGTWLAQTFTLESAYLAWRFALKWAYYRGVEHVNYALRDTDAQGKPTGPDLANDDTMAPLGKTSDSGLWWPGVFDNYPNLSPGTFALILSCPGADTPWLYTARCAIQSDPPYPGKLWKSTDSGVTWDEVPDTVMLHQVWGTRQLTPVPPPQVVSNWAPLDYQHTPVIGGYHVTIETDIPAHLYMRHSFNQPLKHKVARYKRGLPLPWNTYYCFTAWKETDQDEDGDSLIHTFTFYDWPVCQTRWFYFTATKRLFPSPSASPIFELHRLEAEPSRYAYSRIFSHRGSLRTINAGYKMAPTFQITDTPTSSGQFILYTRNKDATMVRASLSLLDEDGVPLDSNLVHDVFSLNFGILIQNVPPSQVVYQHTISLPYAYTPSTPYALILYTIAGSAQWWLSFRDYDWEGEKDEGEANHISLYATHPLYPDWTKIRPYRQCYEAWGS